MKMSWLSAAMLVGGLFAGCTKREAAPPAPPLQIKAAPPVAAPKVEPASIQPPTPAQPPPEVPASPAKTEAPFDAKAAAQQQQQFNDINKILADLSSSDPAAQSRARGAIQRLTPAQRQEFEKLRKLYLGK
ncbi:MAG: hypothetical protein FJ386_02985 [Verrucomicrobia bacterium]|nr:hypothetical protein [Verrucomicrobiota bacterium]